MDAELEDRCRELENTLSMREAELFEARRQNAAHRTQLAALEAERDAALVENKRLKNTLFIDEQELSVQDAEIEQLRAQLTQVQAWAVELTVESEGE